MSKLVQLGGRVKPETKERFAVARGELTFEDITKRLLDALENIESTEQIQQIPEGWISPEAHAEALQLKDNEIGQLKTAHTLALEAKQQEIEGLQTQLQTGENSNTIQLDYKPGENQLLIDVNPFVLFAISDEIQAMAKRHGQELSTGEVLVSFFLEMKKNGSVQAARIWTDREFENYRKQHLTPVE